MPTPATNVDVARALHEGWKGGLSERAAGDVVFSRDYLHGMSELTGRAPGLVCRTRSSTHSLRPTRGPIKNAAHLALIEAIRKSPTVRLSDETVARMMAEHHVPTALEAAVPTAPASPVFPETTPHAIPSAIPQTEAIPANTIYEVKSGDSLTQIMKSKLPALSSLTDEKENVIQNFIHKLSPEDMKRIGIPDPDHIEVGSQIDMKVLNEILESKRISGESLIAHAQHLAGTSPSGTPVSQGVVSATQETLGNASKFSDIQVESVQKAILSAKSNGLVPDELLQGSRASDAKAYMEYMHATDLSEKQKIAEVLGTTTSDMDKKISGILSDPTAPKGTAIPPETPVSAAHAPVKSDVPQPSASSPEKVLSTIPLDRPRAESLAQEYLMKDMTDIRTGKPYPLWLEMKQYSAKDILTLRQDRVEPAMWQKIVTIRKYVADQGFTQEHQIAPLEKETLEAFLRRGHTQHVMEFGTRGSSSSAVGTLAPVPSRVLSETQVPHVPPRAPGEIVRLPRPDNKGVFDSGRNLPNTPPEQVSTPRIHSPSYPPSEIDTNKEVVLLCTQVLPRRDQEYPTESLPQVPVNPGPYQYRRLPPP